MKTATLINSHLSKKNITYISVAVITVLTIVGLSLGFFIMQNTTRANEEAPQNVSVSPQGTSAKVTWQTPSDTIAVIEYGNQADASKFSSFAFSETPTTNHTVDMSSLQPNTTYYFQIRIGEKVYDNGGSFWSFTTSAGETVSPTASAEVLPTASPSATIQPTPTKAASSSASLSPTVTSAVNITPVPSPSIAVGSCPFNDCITIQKNLGTQCKTTDYIKCLLKGGTSTLPTTAPTSAITAAAASSSASISAASRTSCSIDYFQSNSCRSLTWTDIEVKNPSCTAVYTKYFVQCKSNSFTSNDSATWYCNQTTTDNNITVPCGTAPTPAPGQSVFCRVRAETDKGGSSDATPWMYASTSCPQLSSSSSSCAISYLQGNNCKSWLWDRVNSTNPNCKAAFDHYTLQCTSNGDYTGSTGTWYCDTSSSNHYLDFPCYNAPTPVDGSTVQCRVRAEDAYSTDAHATAWVSSSAVCATSTPTPTATNTPTPTNTPTATPIP